jgi:hypothetical protein
MKKLLNLFVFCCISFNLWAQTTSRTFDLRGFKALEMGSAFKIEVQKGAFFSIVATGRQKDLEEIEARVSAGVLKVRYKDSWSGWKNRETVNFVIVMPSLQALYLSGACQAVVKGFEKLEDPFRINLSGATNLELTSGTSESISLEASGASKLFLTGKTGRFTIDVSGATNLDASKLEADEVTIDASGASKISVFANKSLKVEASGATKVRYKGSSTNISTSTSGASSVRRE